MLDLGFGRLDEAEKAYRAAVAAKPGYSEAHNDLGQLLARTGRWEDAIREFDAALGNMLYKTPYVARCNKGLAMYRMGRREDGIAEMRACLSVAPSYCKGRRELGRVLFTDYMFAFEVTSILIIAAMIGAVILARKQIQ